MNITKQNNTISDKPNRPIDFRNTRAKPGFDVKSRDIHVFALIISNFASPCV